MRKDYRDFIMYTSPSESFPLQGEGQTCCASGESCFAWFCGSIVWLCLHGDMGMGAILPHVLAIRIPDFTQIMQTGHFCGPQWKEIRRGTDSRTIVIPKAAHTDVACYKTGRLLTAVLNSELQNVTGTWVLLVNKNANAISERIRLGTQVHIVK